MIKPLIRRASIALVALLALAGWQAPASGDAASHVGRWLGPFSEDGDGDGVGDFDGRAPRTRAEAARNPTAVNLVVLPDGRVLYWSQLEGSESVDRSIAFQLPEGPGSRTRTLDLTSFVTGGSLPDAGDFSTPSPENGAGGDMVGSEQRHLADGRVLAIGGTEWVNEDEGRGVPDGMGRTELYGLADARLFDPLTDTWSLAPSMNRRRYYPSMLSLADGRMLVAAGADRLVYDSSLFPGPNPPEEPFPLNVREVETYDPASNRWTLNDGPGGSAVLPPFAHLHLMPDGSAFYPGAGMFYPPGAADRDAAEWDRYHSYDPAQEAWTAGERIPLGARSNAITAMLPLQPPYDEASILVSGGTTGPWPGTWLATSLSELVSWRDGAVTRTMTGPMNGGRWHGSPVVLPTGEVIALSGADKDEVVDPGSGVPLRHADMFDPVTNRWIRMAEASRGRTLHNTAVLLRDGSILVGGHSPAPAHYGSHTQNPDPFSSNYKDPSFEIFQPPALFRGPRPVIDSISHTTAASGGTLEIGTARAADPTLRVVLTRLPSITHGIDNDQRSVVVGHSVAGDTLTIQIPRAEVVPPGHYYVFLVADNGDGPTPSVASVIRIG